MTETAEMIDPMTGEIIDQKELAEALLEQAREQGVSLLGPGGLLAGLTKNVLETALEAEITGHLGHERHGPAENGNVRNGTPSKTVFREVGPVETDVPRDREGSFEPQIVKKYQRRLDGIDEVVLSLTARGLTTGEIAAHFDDVYGATVSKDTISRITAKVSEEMAEWTNRPLDRVYPVVFIDAIHVKVRDGQVAVDREFERLARGFPGHSKTFGHRDEGNRVRMQGIRVAVTRALTAVQPLNSGSSPGTRSG
jgi:putative transposase